MQYTWPVCPLFASADISYVRLKSCYFYIRRSLIVGLLFSLVYELGHVFLCIFPFIFPLLVDSPSRFMRRMSLKLNGLAEVARRLHLKLLDDRQGSTVSPANYLRNFPTLSAGNPASFTVAVQILPKGNLI